MGTFVGSPAPHWREARIEAGRSETSVCILVQNSNKPLVWTICLERYERLCAVVSSVIRYCICFANETKERGNRPTPHTQHTLYSAAHKRHKLKTHTNPIVPRGAATGKRDRLFLG